MGRFFAASLAALAFFSGGSARADPPPARPDYLFTLPEREWAFAELLWQGRADCTAQTCEAGYHSGDLVVSVIRGTDDATIVAGLRDCPSIAYNVLMPDQLAGLSPEQRLARISESVGSLAALIRNTCNVPGAGEAIETAPLRRLFFED